VLVPESGVLQIVKLSGAAETVYGETITVPGWSAVGIVTGSEIGVRFEDNKIFGIGSKGPQARFAGKPESTLRLELPAPTSAILNLAIPDVDGLLPIGYNFLVGQGLTPWRGVGLKFNTLDLEINETTPLRATMEGIFKAIVASDASAGHDPGTPVVWAMEGLTFNIGGGDPEKGLVSARISVRNNLTGKATADSDNVPLRSISFLQEGNLEIEGTFETYDVPTFSLFDNCPASDVEVQLVLVDICGVGTPAHLYITLTGGMYNDKRQPIRPNEFIAYTVGMTFSGIRIGSVAP